MALVYNEERDTEFMLPITQQLIALLEGDPKGFFEVDVTVDPPCCSINGRIEDPGW